MARQTALVTGASSGIGRDLALQFAAGGYDLVVVARRAAPLDDAGRRSDAGSRRQRQRHRGGPGRAVGPQRDLRSARSRAGTPIDVVVNNAGFGVGGAVAALPLDRQLEMIQVNVTALTALTRLFLPGMLERNRGGILNVRFDRRIPAGPHVGCLLCDQGLRPVLYRGARRGGRRLRPAGELSLPRSDRRPSLPRRRR